MSLEVIVVVIGAIVLIGALIGGGFEVKEIKVPQLGGMVRVLLVIAGIVLIVVGIYLRPGAEDAGAPTQAQANQSVDFRLSEQMEAPYVSEHITVIIDGRNVGTLNTSQTDPKSELLVTVPQAGQHSYTAELTGRVAQDGNEHEFTCSGQGQIDAQANKIYGFRVSPQGESSCIVSLEQQ